MLSLLHLRIALLRLALREGFFLLDLFHGEREPAVFEEVLNLLEGLDIKNDSDLSVVVGYDVVPLDIDHRSSSAAALACTGILGELNDKY